MKFQAEAFDLGAIEFGAGDDRLVAALAKAEGQREAGMQIAQRADGREQDALWRDRHAASSICDFERLERPCYAAGGGARGTAFKKRLDRGRTEG